MYFFPWKLLPMQRSNLKEITTFYTQSPLLSLTSKTSPNSAVKLCRTHAVRCHSASLEVWAGLGNDWSVHEYPISWLPFLADWRQKNPIPSKGSSPKWALLLCHPAPDLSWGEDGVPRQTGRKPVWMERKPRHLSKCNVSAKQRWERQCLQLLREVPHPGSREKAHWGCGWGEAAPQLHDCSWGAGVGLEMPPLRRIPCWQNKQGGAACVEKCSPAWGLRVEGPPSPFILGGVEDETAAKSDSCKGQPLSGSSPGGRPSVCLPIYLSASCHWALGEQR